jgi:hypothetical protein
VPTFFFGSRRHFSLTLINQRFSPGLQQKIFITAGIFVASIAKHGGLHGPDAAIPLLLPYNFLCRFCKLSINQDNILGAHGSATTRLILSIFWIGFFTHAFAYLLSGVEMLSDHVG